NSIDFTRMTPSKGVSVPIFGTKGEYCFWGSNIGLTAIDSTRGCAWLGASGFMQIDGYFSAAEMEVIGNGILGVTVGVNGLPTWSANAGQTGAILRTLMTDAGPGWNSINIAPSASMGLMGVSRLNLYRRRPDMGVSFGMLAQLDTLQTFTDRGPAALGPSCIALGTKKRVFSDQLYLKGSWNRLVGATYAGGAGYVSTSNNCQVFFQYYGKNFALIGVGASVIGTLSFDGNVIGATFNQMLIGSTEQLHTVQFSVTGGTCVVSAIDYTASTGEMRSLQNYFAPAGAGVAATLSLSHVSAHIGMTIGQQGSSAIRCFGYLAENQGSAITYNPDTTNGDNFVINQDGIYTTRYVDTNSSATALGISRNSSVLNVSPASLRNEDLLAFTVLSGSNQYPNTLWTGFLKTGDVLRAHTEHNPNINNDDKIQFWVTQVQAGGNQ